MTQVHETTPTTQPTETQPTPTTTQPAADQRPRRKPKATAQEPATTSTKPGRPTSATKPARSNPNPNPKARAREPKPRRSADEKIADLLAQVERVKEREANRAMRADPAVKLTAAAVRAINKAIAEAQGAEQAELVQALEAAKVAIAAYLEGRGLRVPRSGKGRSAA